MIDGFCRNANGTSFYGDYCEYEEPILKCSKDSISLNIESLIHEKYPRLVFEKFQYINILVALSLEWYQYCSIAFVAPGKHYDGRQDLFIPQHDPGNRFYLFVKVLYVLRLV